MHILILGGNGFIGEAVVAALLARGHAVCAFGRNIAAAARRQPAARWSSVDIAQLRDARDWERHLADVDCVINCAGALQDGGRDDVAALQAAAMTALYSTAAAQLRPPLLVQVSARTDTAAAKTRFLETKRQADSALAASGLPFVILRPAVVIGRNAYGGSALLRALAAFPFVTPLVHAHAPMQFVALGDVANAIVAAVESELASGSDIDLASAQTLTLAQSVAAHRRWLGLPPARIIEVPRPAAALVARLADALGHLGWRSPLRTTAMTIAAPGIARHAPAPELALRTLEETLAEGPAGVQDRWFARLYLLKAPALAGLSLFWLLSGSIALVRFDASAAHLAATGASPALAGVITTATSLVDIGLGLCVAARRFAAAALTGMLLVSLAYLLGATAFAPHLWADPLGPLVKVLPSILLTLVALATLDER